MITDKDITQAEEQEKTLAEAYLSGITDFVKWSSTLAIAAILWIGNNITSVAGPSWVLSAFSLIFLVCSLLLAVFVVRRVLIAWAREWDAAREDYAFSLFKKWKAFRVNEIRPIEATQLVELEKKERERIDRLLDALDATKPFAEPKGFSIWVSWHIGLLIAGLIIYVLAQILIAL